MTTSLSDLFQQTTHCLKQAQTVFLTVHVNPDGDALGSMLACAEMLREAFPHLTHIHPTMVGTPPQNLMLIPGVEHVIDITAPNNLLTQYDVSICLDCGSADRLGDCAELFHGATTSINIDHHASNTLFGTINLLDIQSSATGEVIAQWMEHINQPVTPRIAGGLYTAIVTDTGGFRFSNTRPYTFELAAKCALAGCDTEAYYKAIYENRPKCQALLIAQAIQDTKFLADEHIAYTYVSCQQREHLGALSEHTEGVVDALRQIQGVKVAAFFKEESKNVIKVSLRSDDHHIDVGQIAIDLGGGGHKMASGCTIYGDIDAAKAAILPQLQACIGALAQA